MNEKTSNWFDFSLKVIIALVVPITVAAIGLSGEMIISKAGQNQQNLEIITRQAEAHTAFQRDLFAELFRKYVDDISVAEKPRDIDALATRLELLSSNFSDFIKLRGLYLQLIRQIDRILPSESPDEDVMDLRIAYIDRLKSAARPLIANQRSEIAQYGISYELEVEKDQYDSLYIYTHSQMVMLDGVERNIKVEVLDIDLKQTKVKVRLTSFLEEIEADAVFSVDSFSFPLENNTILSRNHRVALSIVALNEYYCRISVDVFPSIKGSNLDALIKRSVAR